jgi:eukaryotic-like serine/threonine-protein kinase
MACWRGRGLTASGRGPHLMRALPTAIGRYQLRERLAQGGMGVLYLALDPAIDRLVALKLLRVNNAELRERFLREARLCARLQHSNIVTIFDVGQHEGQPFIAMEYIPGETLAEIIHRRAPLGLTKKLSYMIDASNGLAFAHKSNIIHRDVKPANLMVSRDAGVVKVLDFGIARGADSGLTQAGMLIGTPNYMSPEQVQQHTIDHRSDIFAMGVVLYELLVYRAPFDAETQHSVLHRIVHEEPEPVTRYNPDLDPALVRILDRTLAKSPDDRYQDLSQFKADLTRVVQKIEAEQRGHTQIVEAAPVQTPGAAGRLADKARLLERRAARIARHLDAAQESLAQGELDTALNEAELAAEIDPDDPRVIKMHDRVRAALDARELTRCLDEARERLQAGDLTSASDALMRAMKLSPDSREVSDVRHALDAALEERERVRERERKVTRALEHAREAFEVGAFDSALRATTEALGYSPEDPAALEWRQRIQAAVDQRAEEAVAAARADYEAGRITSALRRLESFKPNHGRVDDTIEWIHADIAERERIRRDEEEAAKKALAAWVSSETGRAEAALGQGRWNEAIESLDAIHERAPETPGLEHMRARAERGLAEARRAEEANALMTNARAALDEQDFARALDLARQAQELVPASLDAVRLEHEIVSAQAADEERRRREAEDARARQAVVEATAQHVAGRLAEAIALLDAFTPRHPLVTRLLVDLKSEQIARARAEEEARREEERRKKEEERRKKEEEARLKAEAEARQKAEEARKEERRKKEEERGKKEEEARLKAEAEARRKAEEARKEERKKEEERRKKKEEARLKAEAEARQKAEEARKEERRKKEEERRKKEEEARIRVEAEARRKADEEAARRRREEEWRAAEATRRREEEEREQANAERRAAAAVAWARAEAERGRLGDAITYLEATPPHALVSGALAELREQQARISSDDTAPDEPVVPAALALRPPEAVARGLQPAGPALTRRRLTMVGIAAGLAGLIGLGIWLAWPDGPGVPPAEKHAATGPVKEPAKTVAEPRPSTQTSKSPDTPPESTTQPESTVSPTEPGTPPAGGETTPTTSVDSSPYLTRARNQYSAGNLPGALATLGELARLDPSQMSTVRGIAEPWAKATQQRAAEARKRVEPRARPAQLSPGRRFERTGAAQLRNGESLSAARSFERARSFYADLDGQLTAAANKTPPQPTQTPEPIPPPDQSKQEGAEWARNEMNEAGRAISQREWSRAIKILESVRQRAPQTPGLDSLLKHARDGQALEASQAFKSGQRPPEPYSSQPEPAKKPEPDPNRTAQNGAIGVLQQYLAAWNQLDAAAVGRLDASINAELLARTFGNIAEHRVTCGGVAWQDVTPNRVVFACQWRQEVTKTRGGGRPDSVNRGVVFTVEPRNGRWTIVDRRYR